MLMSPDDKDQLTSQVPKFERALIWGNASARRVATRVKHVTARFTDSCRDLQRARSWLTQDCRTQHSNPQAYITYTQTMDGTDKNTDESSGTRRSARIGSQSKAEPPKTKPAAKKRGSEGAPQKKSKKVHIFCFFNVASHLQVLRVSFAC
jgi:hypothetical protein